MRFVGVRTGDVKASVTASVRVGAVCLAILLVEALGVGGGGRNVGVTGREMCSFVVVAGGQLELVGNLEVGVAGLAVGGDPGRRRTGEPLRSLADVTGQLCARGAPGARPGGGIASCRECGKGLKMETNIGERFVYSYASIRTLYGVNEKSRGEFGNPLYNRKVCCKGEYRWSPRLKHTTEFML